MQLKYNHLTFVFTILLAVHILSLRSTPNPEYQEMIEVTGTSFSVKKKKAGTIKAQGSGEMDGVEANHISAAGQLTLKQSKVKTLDGSGIINCQQSSGDEAHIVGEAQFEESEFSKVILSCKEFRTKKSSFKKIEAMAEKVTLIDSQVRRIVIKENTDKTRSWIEQLFGLNRDILPVVVVNNSTVGEVIFKNNDGLVVLRGPEARVLYLEGGQIIREKAGTASAT